MLYTGWRVTSEPGDTISAEMESYTGWMGAGSGLGRWSKVPTDNSQFWWPSRCLIWGWKLKFWTSKLCQLCQLYNASLFFKLVDLGTPRFNFANWQLPVSRLATPSFQTVTSQFSICQLTITPFFPIKGHQKLPISPTSPTSPTELPKLQLTTPSFQTVNWQSLLYFHPGASETANLTNLTNFANWVAKVATDNSQFPNCQLDNHSSISVPGPQKLPTWPTSPTSPTELPKLQLTTPSFQTVNVN
jgi:hypothetical protein